MVQRIAKLPSYAMGTSYPPKNTDFPSPHPPAQPIMPVSDSEHCNNSAAPSCALKSKTNTFRIGYWFFLHCPLLLLPTLFSVCEPHSVPQTLNSLLSLLLGSMDLLFPLLGALCLLIFLCLPWIPLFSKQSFLDSCVWVKCLY